MLQSLHLRNDFLPPITSSMATEVTRLKPTAAHSEILESMRHPHTGVGFLTQHPSLPSQTFVSADAVQWLNSHIEGGVSVEVAVLIMKVIIGSLLPDKPTVSYQYLLRLVLWRSVIAFIYMYYFFQLGLSKVFYYNVFFKGG